MEKCVQNTTKKYKILIVNENLSTSVNGVVTTLNNTKHQLELMGHEVFFVQPDQFFNIPCPTYPEVRLSVNVWKFKKILESIRPDCIHISTEGPLGFFVAKYLDNIGKFYTTAYHTKLPEYVNKRFKFISPNLIYSYLRNLHKNSKNVLVTTGTIKQELEQKKFKNLVVWSRGVDSQKFSYSEPKNTRYIKVLYVGRVSIEKNIEALLDCSISGMKVDVVGDGPDLPRLKQKYKDKSHITFHGAKHGSVLVNFYQNADVMAFPSKTDTFGLVMLEAMACGTPVAGYPVAGPIDIVQNGVNGFLSDNIHDAIMGAYLVPRESCRRFAETMSWKSTTEVFLNNMVNLHDGNQLIR
jgi:glycosyltransferase involved in cell wall biosynthesis